MQLLIPYEVLWLTSVCVIFFSLCVCVWACDNADRWPFFSFSFKVNLRFRIILTNFLSFILSNLSSFSLSAFFDFASPFVTPTTPPVSQSQGLFCFAEAWQSVDARGKKCRGRQLTLPASLNRRVNLQWGHNGFSLANHPRCRQPVTSRVPVCWPFVVSLCPLMGSCPTPIARLIFAIYRCAEQRKNKSTSNFYSANFIQLFVIHKYEYIEKDLNLERVWSFIQIFWSQLRVNWSKYTFLFISIKIKSKLQSID